MVADRTSKMLAQIADEEIAARRIQPEGLKEIEGKKGEYLRPGVERGRFAALARKS